MRLTMAQFKSRSAICSHDIAADHLVEICQVGRSQASGVIPARRGRIVQVVSTCHIIEGLHAVIPVGSEVEHTRRIGILANLMDQALIDQGNTGRPDRRGRTCPTNGPPLAVEVDGQAKGRRGNLRNLAMAIGVLVINSTGILPIWTRIDLTESSTTAPTILTAERI